MGAQCVYNLAPITDFHVNRGSIVEKFSVGTIANGVFDGLKQQFQITVKLRLQFRLSKSRKRRLCVWRRKQTMSGNRIEIAFESALYNFQDFVYCRKPSANQ